MPGKDGVALRSPRFDGVNRNGLGPQFDVEVRIGHQVGVPNRVAVAAMRGRDEVECIPLRPAPHRNDVLGTTVAPIV
jgi:hypothetical protein